MNQDANNIKLLLVVGIAVMLLLFVSFLLIFIFNQRNKYRYRQNIQQLRESQQNQLIEAAVRSEETERHRIAEELHDEVGALLSATKLHIQGLQTGDTKGERVYHKGKELLDEAIGKVRGISHSLHSSILQEFGLNEAIRHFVNKLSHEGVIETGTSLDDSYEANALNDISIYRIVQELINNLLKHAHPTVLFISSQYRNAALQLTISHNGHGLSQDEFEKLKYLKEGLGLKNIQNRMILLKGDIQFYLKDGSYYIEIIVPKKVSENEQD